VLIAAVRENVGFRFFLPASQKNVWVAVRKIKRNSKQGLPYIFQSFSYLHLPIRLVAEGGFGDKKATLRNKSVDKVPNHTVHKNITVYAGTQTC